MPKTQPSDKDSAAQSLLERSSEKLAFITATFATAALLKQKGFSLALRVYSRGGAGLNIYKHCNSQSKQLRRFALDYHPIWDKTANKATYKLHYHRGKSFNQIRKHRPYQGGW